MERHCRVICSALCALILAASLTGCCWRKHRHLVEAPEAPPVTHGVDVFQTSTSAGTGVDFATHPLPPGFFCPGSPQFDGQIALMGVPLGGAAAGGDTIVERLKDASFTTGAARIPVKVRALTLTSANPLSVSCTSGPTQWRLDVCLCDNQPTTEIAVKVDPACGCGHFDGALRLKTCLRFTNVGDNKVIGPIHQEVNLKISNMPWCPKPMQNALVIPGPFTVKDCDGKDMNLPGTSNFFPGYTCAEQAPGVDCWTKFASLTHCHEGPSPTHQHCVNPVCGERKN